MSEVQRREALPKVHSREPVQVAEPAQPPLGCTGFISWLNQEDAGLGTTGLGVVSLTSEREGLASESPPPQRSGRTERPNPRKGWQVSLEEHSLGVPGHCLPVTVGLPGAEVADESAAEARARTGRSGLWGTGLSTP